MKNHRKLLPALFVAVCAVLLLGLATSASAQTLTTSNGRPIADGVQQIEKQYLVPITYEDTIYVSDQELDPKTHSTPVGIGTLSFNSKPATKNAPIEDREALASEALNDLLQKYKDAKGADMFTVTTTDEIIHVKATHFFDKSGHLEELTPFFDVPVSLSGRTRTGKELLTEVFEAVTAQTGQKIDFGTVDGGLMAHQTNISADNEPARQVLDRLLIEVAGSPDEYSRLPPVRHEVHGFLAWRLLCDPLQQFGCFFNAHRISPPTLASMQTKPNYLAPPPGWQNR